MQNASCHTCSLCPIPFKVMIFFVSFGFLAVAAAVIRASLSVLQLHDVELAIVPALA